mgnify:CR=1 FL=1
MKKQNVKEVLLPAVALLLICLIASLLLASTNAITKEKILEAQLAQKETNKKLIFSAAASFSDENSVTIAETKVVEYSTALNENREPIGYVFTCSAKGYGGPVSVMTGIDPSGTVVRVLILSMDDETPGLGQNAGKDEFLNLFSGQSAPFTWAKSGGSGSVITGVTSATYTSKAVIQCVNDASLAFTLLQGGTK